MAETYLSNPEKLYIIHGIELGIRSDGRSCEDFRNINLETDVLESCCGSCRIRLANTDVLIGVKCEIGEPLNTKPNLGILHFFVDCSANATPMFEGRGGDDFANTISSALSEAYTFPEAMDLASLCLIPGMKCWHVFIDILLLEVGGNVFDCVSIGVKAALQHTSIVSVEVVPGDGCTADLEVSDDPYNVIKLNASNAPILVTSFKIGSSEVVDATIQEEDCSNAKLLVGVNLKGECCFMRKLGSSSLHPETIQNMIKLSCRTGARIHQRLSETFLKPKQISNQTNSFLNIGFLNI